MSRILFYTPFAGYSGSERALGNIIRYADRAKFQMALASDIHGPLLSQVSNEVPAFSLPSYLGNRPLFTKVANKVEARLGGRRPKSWRFFQEIDQRIAPDFWYLNTAILSQPLNYLAHHNIPCVVHVHELCEPLYPLARDHVWRLSIILFSLWLVRQWCGICWPPWAGPIMWKFVRSP